MLEAHKASADRVMVGLLDAPYCAVGSQIYGALIPRQASKTSFKAGDTVEGPHRISVCPSPRSVLLRPPCWQEVLHAAGQTMAAQHPQMWRSRASFRGSEPPTSVKLEESVRVPMVPMPPWPESCRRKTRRATLVVTGLSRSAPQLDGRLWHPGRRPTLAWAPLR